METIPPTQAATRLVLPPLLTRWLVQYNPLFTASALCVLAGVYVLSQAMGGQADVGLTALLDAYQWLVVTAAAFLYRRGQRRPAVMLAVIQLFCMTDPTLQLAALASSGAWWASAVWVASFVAKLVVLSRVFCLKVSRSALVIPALGAALVAMLPLLRVWGLSSRETVGVLLGLSVFAVGLLADAWRPAVESTEPLEGFASVVFTRLRRGMVWLGAGAVAYHAWNSALAVGLSALAPALGAAVLLWARAAKDEKAMWVRAVVGLVLSAQAGASGVILGLALLAVALSLASDGRAPRVLVGALLASYGALHQLAAASAGIHLPEEALLAVAVAVPLLWLFKQRHAWSALAVVLGIGAHLLGRMDVSGPALGRMEWGVLLVAAGFLFLPVGVWMHGWLERAVRSAPAGSTVTPSTSVAIPDQMVP